MTHFLFFSIFDGDKINKQAPRINGAYIEPLEIGMKKRDRPKK